MKKQILNYVIKKMAIWAREVIEREKPEIIAITGSIAKTSTKEAIYSVMRQKFGNKVGKSPGNLNSETGLPLAILNFNKGPNVIFWPVILLIAWVRKRFVVLPQYLILEMGADKPGDIIHLVSIAKPKVAVVTAVGKSHLGSFKSEEGVAKEKEELIKALPEEGIAVINGNFSLVSRMAKQVKGKVVIYKPEDDQIAQEAAREVGKIYGLDDNLIEKGLKNFESIGGRFKLIEGVKGSLIIDDSYNANPLSMEIALRKLEKLGDERKGRKVAILGDMLDLGEATSKAHEEIFEIAKNRANVVLVVGKAWKDLPVDHSYENSEAAGEKVLKRIEEGDIILVKGSHGVHMEKIVEKLKARR